MILERKYELSSKIGEGSFGYVLKARNIITDKPVAVKIEPSESITLKNEAKIYKLLNNIIGVPILYSYGNVNTISYLIMDMLGSPITPNVTYPHFLNIGKQSLEIMKHMHNHKVLHRDIKPDNFLFDRDNKMLYLIDYGVATYHESYETTNDTRSFIGTPIYSSLSVHNGVSYTRSDDLESLGYTLLWFLEGEIDWEHDNHDIILKKKRYLCCDPDIEEDVFIYDWVRYCRTLSATDVPLYDDLYIILNDFE